ncbi:MAG: 4-hydroxy-2-oxovalerate aldolase, partial [Flammeovirgaceae bacterium]
NLGLSVINSITALQAGASILDATACGLGAGAGNTPLGVLVAALHRMGYEPRLKADLYQALRAGTIAKDIFCDHIPSNSEATIISGLNGVFSGFTKPVLRIATELDVDPKRIFFELGARKIVGGQEDIIIEIAHDLKKGNRL